jgi:hypothetical protein
MGRATNYTEAPRDHHYKLSHLNLLVMVLAVYHASANRYPAQYRTGHTPDKEI